MVHSQMIRLSLKTDACQLVPFLQLTFKSQDLSQAMFKGNPLKKAEKYSIIFTVKCKTTAENPTGKQNTV